MTLQPSQHTSLYTYMYIISIHNYNQYMYISIQGCRKWYSRYGFRHTTFSPFFPFLLGDFHVKSKLRIAIY